MKTFTSWLNHPEDFRGASVAIGNFDGVHLGHQAVLKIAETAARANGNPFGVLTFEPHPREFFAPDAPPFRLMNAEAKSNRLAKIGVDHLYQLPFDRHLAGLEARAFAAEVICGGLGLSHVVVGTDFKFGKGRSGAAEDLRAFGAEMGFDVTISELVRKTEDEISSTAIRTALSQGRPRDAQAMLGHWHRIDGIVMHGEKRGRQLGYPTANLAIAGLHPPKFGVYATWVDVLTGPHAGTYMGATSVGVRPMFGENVANCETYLMDFSGDLYDAHISVALVDFLRPELQFETLDALVAQMGADCDEARRILSAL